MSMDLVADIYAFTKKLPKDEEYGLVSQMRRAAVSIPSNISEGSQRGGRDFAHFLKFSSGSAAELDTQLKLVERLYKLDIEAFPERITEIQRMLHGLMKKVR